MAAFGAIKLPQRAGGLVLWLCLALMALMSGCATTSASGPSDAASAPLSKAEAHRRQIDPWESWNRKVFAFNEGLDEHVMRPVATAYTKIVPSPIRTGISNFFNNFSDAWSAVNSFLQGKFAEGAHGVMRVGTNTVFGLLGVLDVATEAGLERHSQDFGLTLGRWGMGSGPYVVWPLFGPSTLRESIALPVDLAVSPSFVGDTEGIRWGIAALQVTDTRARVLGASSLLDEISLDKYSFMRDAYLQRRLSLIYDGDVPASLRPPTDDDEDDPPAPQTAPQDKSKSSDSPDNVQVSAPLPSPVSPAASAPSSQSL